GRGSRGALSLRLRGVWASAATGGRNGAPELPDAHQPGETGQPRPVGGDALPRARVAPGRLGCRRRRSVARGEGRRRHPAGARTPRWVSRAHPTRIRRVAWSPDGTRLASGGEDGSLYVWKASDGTLLQRLQGHRGVVYGVVWSPDGTRLASGGGSRGSGEVVLW